MSPCNATSTPLSDRNGGFCDDSALRQNHQFSCQIFMRAKRFFLSAANGISCEGDASLSISANLCLRLSYHMEYHSKESSLWNCSPSAFLKVKPWFETALPV